jgi:SPP1 family predicted phage head-tail adaptor
MLQAGKLRHRGTLKSLSQSQNEYGEPSDTWTTVTTVWMAIEPLQGKELIMAQQTNALATIRVTLRYNSTVDPSDRVVVGSRTLEIVEVINPRELGEYLVLMCKEVV